MYDLQPYLKTIDEVIARGLIGTHGSHCLPIRFQNGTETQNSGFLSTGGSSAFLRLETNGIQEICIFRILLNTNIISRPMGRIRILGIRILSPCFGESALIRSNGRICSRKREPGMWFRLRNFMMDSRCIKVKYLTGMPMRWDRSGMCWERSAQAVRSEEWHWVHPVTGLSIGFYGKGEGV